jgi:hypothetical protein
MLSDLARAIRERQAILFVGAGVSAGLGLPPWHELIQHIGQELGYEADVFTALDAGYLALAEYYNWTIA